MHIFETEMNMNHSLTGIPVTISLFTTHIKNTKVYLFEGHNV